MVGFEIQGVALTFGDESVIAVVGDERQLGTGRRFDPPYDEPHRHSVGLTGERCVAGLGHVGRAFHPVCDGRPLPLGYGLDEITQLGKLADGDGEAGLAQVANTGPIILSDQGFLARFPGGGLTRWCRGLGAPHGGCGRVVAFSPRHVESVVRPRSQCRLVASFADGRGRGQQFRSGLVDVPSSRASSIRSFSSD